jgi:hypothetical protein
MWCSYSRRDPSNMIACARISACTVQRGPRCASLHATVRYRCSIRHPCSELCLARSLVRSTIVLCASQCGSRIDTLSLSIHNTVEHSGLCTASEYPLLRGPCIARVVPTPLRSACTQHVLLSKKTQDSDASGLGWAGAGHLGAANREIGETAVRYCICVLFMSVAGGPVNRGALSAAVQQGAQRPR